MVGPGRSWPSPEEGWMAWCKGSSHKGPMVGQRQWKTQTRDNVVQGTQKGWTFSRRHWVQPEYSNGIRDRDVTEQLCLRKDRRTGNGIRGWSRRQELCLGSTRTLYEACGQTHMLEIVKWTVGSSVRIWKMSNSTLWRGQPTLKRKKSIVAA
jgi:hypothetical protein